MKNPHPECRISLNFKISFLTKSNFSRLSDGSKERFSKRVVIVDELNDDTYLDREKKIKVFSTVAAIIGYKKE